MVEHLHMYVHIFLDTYSDRHVQLGLLLCAHVQLDLLLCAGVIALFCAVLCCAVLCSRHCYRYSTTTYS